MAHKRKITDRLAAPVPPPPIGLREVGANAGRREVHQDLIAVIPLVPDQLAHRVGDRLHRLDLLGGRDDRRGQRLRVAVIRRLHRDADHRTGVQVNRMFGFLGQMGAPVLHLRYFRVGIVRMRPVVVRPLLLPRPIDPCQVRARGRRDARGLCQAGQKGIIALARVAPHDTAQGGIRFEGGGIDADRLPRDQAGVGQTLQHPRKHRRVGLQIDQPPRPRDRRVVGGGVWQLQMQEATHTQRVRRPPRDRPLRVQPFKVAEHQQPEVPPRRQTRPPDPVGVKARALRLDECVEARVIEQPVQPLVERVRGAAGRSSESTSMLAVRGGVVCPSP